MACHENNNDQKGDTTKFFMFTVNVKLGNNFRFL